MFQHTCVKGLLTFSHFAGELPKELGDLVNLADFHASYNKFQGESDAPAYMRCMSRPFRVFACKKRFHVFAGELPKELGKLINLKEFRISNNCIGGELCCMSQHTCVCAFC